jgi:hypothetical protein
MTNTTVSDKAQLRALRDQFDAHQHDIRTLAEDARALGMPSPRIEFTTPDVVRQIQLGKSLYLHWFRH